MSSKGREASRERQRVGLGKNESEEVMRAIKTQWERVRSHQSGEMEYEKENRLLTAGFWRGSRSGKDEAGFIVVRRR